MITLDPVKEALEVVIKIDDLISNCKHIIKEEVKEIKAHALERRGKDLPALVLQSGFVTSITFYLSKLDSEVLYSKTYNKLRGFNTELDKNYCNDLSNDLREEGKGYTIMLALVNYYLSKIAESKQINECKNLNGIISVAKCLKTLRESTEAGEFIVESLMMPYLIELKKLLEALYGEKS